MPDDSEIVAAKGSFWFDPASLDLVRLDVHGEAIPYSLGLEETGFQTFYARTRIGDSDALLPKRSELTMTHFSGEASRDVVEFSQCREYASESTIRFDAPSPSLPEVLKPQVRQVDLPAGLLVRVELETPIDSKTAVVGDPVHARVLRGVRYKGDLAVPQGAAITGHICRLGRSSGSAPFAVGIELSEIEWEGTWATFYAELVDLKLPRLATHYNQPLIDNEIPGAGIFYIDGAKFRIPPGYHMLWRTLAHPRSAVHEPR